MRPRERTHGRAAAAARGSARAGRSPARTAPRDFRADYRGGSVVEGSVVAPGTPVPPGTGGQLGSRVLVVSLQSTVLVRLDELSVCDAVPASARLLLLEVPLVEDVDPVAPLLSLPCIDEHPASNTATNAAAVALAIPNCFFMTAPLHLDQ